MARFALAGLALAMAAMGHARATEQVSVCFNYSCARQETVAFDSRTLKSLETWFAAAPDARAERAIIARAIGHMYQLAGRQTPVSADRAGNLLDAGANGRMDCIDHSRNTAMFLRLMQRRGWLRFHRAEHERARRSRFIFAHYAAVIRRAPQDTGHDNGGARRFAVDSWFVEHGEPAVVLPLAQWLRGEGPNVQ